MKRLLTALLLAPILFALPVSAEAYGLPQAKGPRLIGTLKVTPTLGLFRIPLPGCGNSLKQVKLTIAKGTIFIREFGLTFSDGTARRTPVNSEVSERNDVPWMNLNDLRRNDTRCVKDIFAVAKSSSRASVEVKVFGDFEADVRAGMLRF